MLNPTIFNGVVNYVYDPDSGNFALPPANDNWSSASRWQGPAPGTFVQAATNLFTSRINTLFLPVRTVPGAGSLHNLLSYTNASTTKQRPFGDSIQISWSQSIDSFSQVNGGVAQLNAYIYFRDPDGNLFTMVFGAYDNRHTSYAPLVSYNGSVYFGSTPVGNTKYCTSNNVMTTVGSGTINYSLTFTKAHLSTALTDLANTGIAVKWSSPADWVIHEIGIIHETYKFNNANIQVQSNVSFSSPTASNLTEAYPSTITFSQGYPVSRTMIPGIQTLPDFYSIQSTAASNINIGAGTQTLTFNWRSYRYFELNPVGHVAFILRANDEAVRESTRKLQGTGLLFGNLSEYYNPDTGHVGNPLFPSTIVETWYNGLHTFGNDLIPGTWGTQKLQDDVTYQVEIKSTIDSNGASFVSYRVSSSGILINSSPLVADNNTYYDRTQTGIIVGHVFGSGTAGWNINLSNLSVTWAAAGAAFTITPDKTTVNEGEVVTWTVITSNIPDGTVLYWTRSGNSDSGDFSDTIVGPSDGASGSIVIYGNAGTFSRTVSLDYLTEGSETVVMSIRQGSISGVIEATAATVTIIDTSVATPGEIWNISPDNANVNEGDTVTWNITTTNVTDGIYWWTNSGTTNGQDFSDFIAGPGDGLSDQFTITGGSGSFSRTITRDLKTEGPETIIMNIRKGSSAGQIVATSSTVNVDDSSTAPASPTTPAYSVSPNKTLVNEGDTVTWNIITANVPNGTTLFWTNLGTTTGQDFGGGNSGSFTITSGLGSFSRTLAIDALPEGTEDIIIAIRTGSIFGPIVANAATVTVADTSTSTAPSYIVTPDKTTVTEGETVTWTATTSNISDGTVLYWTRTGTAEVEDFSDAITSTSDKFWGLFEIRNNTGSFSRSLVKDFTTEGTETILIAIRTGSITGPIVYVCPAVYISDTSLSPPVYNVAPELSAAYEGSVVVYRVNTENILNNTTLFWTTDAVGTTTNSNDFIDTVTSGTVVVSLPNLDLNKGRGIIFRSLAKDNTNDNTKTMILRVRVGSTDGPIVATAKPVVIIDSSRTPNASWETTGTIGTLVTGKLSELYVKGQFSTSTIYANYSLIDGALPTGLTLNRDGTISGRVEVDTEVTTSTVVSTFTVAINDTNNNNLLNGVFSIAVDQTDNTLYTEIYTKPFLTQDKRGMYADFIRDEKIFAPNLLYRKFDPNFGLQEELKLVIDFGIKQESLRDYSEFISTNFYRRTMLLSELKTAVSKNADGSVKHEIIYVDVIDKHVNSNKISVPAEIILNGITYYPPSIPNMRATLASKTTLTTIRNPNFTNFVQAGESVKSEYIAFVPLCFTLPGKSATIIRKINESGFKFNTIDFEIDRIVIQNVLGQIGAKYLLLHRNSRLA